MAVKDDFLGYGEEQCGQLPFLFFVQSNEYGLILVMAVTSSGKGMGWEGMFQEIHELFDVFHWHHLPKAKTKHCCVICFIIWSKQVARPALKKESFEQRGRSGFLTRGTFADGEGDTEEDDYDDIIEPSLP